jgi:hypothetical protein
MINELLGKQHPSNKFEKLSFYNKHLTNQYDVAEALNTYCASMIDKMNINKLGNMTHKASLYTAI